MFGSNVGFTASVLVAIVGLYCKVRVLGRSWSTVEYYIVV